VEIRSGGAGEKGVARDANGGEEEDRMRAKEVKEADSADRSLLNNGRGGAKRRNGGVRALCSIQGEGTGGWA